MDTSNKNLLRRRLGILLMLTLCTGLCTGADAIPSEITLAEGESRELGDGYSITVTKIDLRADRATFELIKNGESVDYTTVYSGEWFKLGFDAENFYFKATLDAIFSGATMTLVKLTSCEGGYTSGTGGEDTTDTTPPTVTEKSPTGENVPVTTRIAITFSEPMNKELTEMAFYIYDSMQNEVSGEFSWDGDTMIFTPSSNLDYDTRYFAYLGIDAMDLAGNSVDWDGWNFKTRPPNNPPYTPKTPSGPDQGYVGASYSYSIFTDDPDDDQIRYTFDWGDGTASETELVESGRSASQSHVWDDEGEYSVRVMAADSESGESGWSPPLVVAISERAHPTAIISANPTVITEGETISFSAEGSEPGDPDSRIVSYDWDFGDGYTGSGVNLEHRYLDSWYYTVTLTVTDSNDLSDRDTVEITVNPAEGIPPTAHIRIYPNPADEGESVTLRGWGRDEDGEVVGCRWTLPDGSIRSYSGSSSDFTLEPDDVQAGVYRFAVRDDDGMWSEEVGEELDVVTKFPTEPVVPVVLAAIAVLAAGTILRRILRKRGSILATSDPTDAEVFVDVKYKGRSPKTINNVLIGPHTVLFSKPGYFGCKKDTVVVPDQTTPVHCDLTKIHKAKLKLSADPAEIVADGKSESTIGIEIVTKDDNEIPLPVPEELTVVLETDLGTIESPVRIPRCHTSTISALRSSGSSGTATVKAETEYGKIVKLKGSTTVEFLDAESK